MTDKVQKIREEVERLQNELIQERGKYYSSDVDDACILELKNVLTYIDSLQEEPVNEDLEKAADKMMPSKYCWSGDGETTLYTREQMKDYFKAGANWQKTKEELVSEDLEEACEQLAENARKHKAETQSPFFSQTDYKQGVIDGAKWQKEQFEKDYTDLCNGIATAKGLAVTMAYDKGMADAREQMMAKAVEAVVSQVPCSNEIILYNPSSVDKYYLPQEMNKLGLNKGDKVKLIIIKEE